MRISDRNGLNQVLKRAKFTTRFYRLIIISITQYKYDSTKYKSVKSSI